MLKGEKQVVFNSIKETDEMVASAEVSVGSALNSITGGFMADAEEYRNDSKPYSPS